MVSERDARRLWKALRVSSLGKAFPRAVSSILPIILHSQYRGVALFADPIEAYPATDMVGADHVVLAPRCQCASMISRPKDGIRREYVSNATGSGPLLKVGGVVPVAFSKRSFKSLPGHSVLVPEWVAHSVYKRELLVPETRDLESIQLRFQCVPKARLTNLPPQLEGCHLFRRKPAPCRCVTPWQLPALHAAIDRGLRGAHALLSSAKDSLQDYVGAVGVNAGMRRVMGNARICFDWHFLTEHVPRQRHYEAFFELCDDLLPMLRASKFPDGDEWAFVGTHWPQRRGPLGWFQQYRTLMARVRFYAARCKSEGNGLPWFIPQAHMFETHFECCQALVFPTLSFDVCLVLAPL